MATVNQNRLHRFVVGWARYQLEHKGPLSGKQAADLAVPPGYIRLAAQDDEQLAVLLELGERHPGLISDGYADWEVVDRPGRLGLTEFRGQAPSTYEFDVVLDGRAKDTPVLPALQTLEALAGTGPASTPGRPPTLAVETTTGIWSGPYILTEIVWSTERDDVLTDDNGRLLLAHATVTIKQYVTARSLATTAARARSKLQGERGGSRRTYTAKTGDTLVSIARAKLGDAGRWTDLAKLNGIRDPRSIRAGAKIKLP